MAARLGANAVPLRAQDPGVDPPRRSPPGLHQPPAHRLRRSPPSALRFRRQPPEARPPQVKPVPHFSLTLRPPNPSFLFIFLIVCNSNQLL
ncbi:uncharacterized protein M6B38_289350 [Iris pallida]|uniref:Uncharacterized protein n=1 Tax=Iris pallida TaxID=29817 RepID=A0AAX6HXZ7_IRIPA|nr:uncharacterized protein M6B38_289350 [Iris pallida]